jgi:hypothetical protein
VPQWACVEERQAQRDEFRIWTVDERRELLHGQAVAKAYFTPHLCFRWLGDVVVLGPEGQPLPTMQAEPSSEPSVGLARDALDAIGVPISELDVGVPFEKKGSPLTVARARCRRALGVLYIE